MTTTKILMAMPCAHSLVKMGAMKTMVEAGVAFAAAGCEVGVATFAVSDVVFSRNFLASIALRDDCTHLFFVDSDMRFPSSLAMRLLEADKDVVGLIYPRRVLDLADLVRLARADPEAPNGEIISKAMTYVVRLPPKATFEKGLAQVEGIGMGGALIRTSVLRTMIERGVAEPRAMPASMSDSRVDLYGFFDTMVLPNGEHLSEDFSFCRRWLDCDGAVWGLDTGEVEHTGDFGFVGSLLAKSADKPAGAPKKR